MIARATGHLPYPYQQKIADEGLPDLLRVPTGAGKTLAATLPWLYRRRFHDQVRVRQGTPRWLVVVLPQRALVEQTVGVVRVWLERLDLAEAVRVHLLMGGESTGDRVWKMRPADDGIFVGTQDMVLSRLLLRGYAEPRAAWPIAFGLLHSGVQFVFDEVQLMGPALPTSLQLEGLRAALGCAAPARSMWMSATVDSAQLCAPDYAGPRTVVELGPDDRGGVLRKRLEATRTVERGSVATETKRYEVSLAELVHRRHAAASRTIVVVNTVDRATRVYDALVKAGSRAEVVLLHARFRPGDREGHTTRALAEPGEHGTIVVATQVLEAGIDVSSRLLVTEVAPWSSLVQRAGRCNRAGEHQDATLVWLTPPTERGWAAPYAEPDLIATTAALAALEGQRVTSTALQDNPVDEQAPLHPVLRRRDLLDLVDTQPDLAGNDLDVGRWIRDEDMRTAAVAWRGLAGEQPDGTDTFPTRDELCPVPVGELRERIRAQGGAVVYDQTTGEWKAAKPEDVRPGAVLVLDAAKGGYLADRGWSPASREPVDPASHGVEPVDAMGSDPLSVSRGRWVTLTEHLADVRREVVSVFEEFGDLPGLTAACRDAAALAGLYHDLGKAHPVFVDTLRRSTDGDPPGPGPWAKSPGDRRAKHRPPYFRHELVSALVVLDPSSPLLDGAPEPDLVAYLVGAHHGKVRLSVRSMPREEGTVLGVRDNDEPTLAVVLPDGREVPPTRPRLARLALGADNGHDSWQAMACRLRDRSDLGPFRLAFLEAVVRVADWRASAGYDVEAAEVPR